MGDVWVVGEPCAVGYLGLSANTVCVGHRSGEIATAELRAIGGLVGTWEGGREGGRGGGRDRGREWGKRGEGGREGGRGGGR